MTYLLDGAWILVKVLSYGSLAVGLIGVAIFGWYFVGINARAAQSESTEIPKESWKGKGAKLGLRLLVLGALIELASMILSVVIPGRH